MSGLFDTLARRAAGSTQNGDGTPRGRRAFLQSGAAVVGGAAMAMAIPGGVADAKTICPPGWTNCSGVCVEKDSDPNHCGGCGKVCTAGAICANGKCAFCPPETYNCSNSCVDLRADLMNCGACGNVCPPCSACEGGDCVAICPAGQVACNGICTFLAFDPDNCGTCGHTCPSGSACVSGSCTQTFIPGDIVCGQSPDRPE
jgi:hypothetical protein